MSEPDHESAPILVPVDFSPFSRSALIWGARAATHFDAPLEVLHVVHDPGSNPRRRLTKTADSSTASRKIET
jgi:hypothetical protein